MAADHFRLIDFLFDLRTRASWKNSRILEIPCMGAFPALFCAIVGERLKHAEARLMHLRFKG